MINKRLMKLIPEASQYVMKQVGMQWLCLVTNIGFILLISAFISESRIENIQSKDIIWLVVITICLILIRFFCTKRATYYSFMASKDVKNQMRSRLYRKLLTLKNDYTSHISTSELVQLSVEGIDQLEIYFGKYLSQFFYSMLAPFTLFLILIWIDFKSAIVLLLCVPLIPLSIVAVQKFAKRLLAKYWTSYATLGDSFLENLQGLTTLKIYQADEFKNQEMNEKAELFRKVTMKVLAMQLNSISVMDIVAYGGSVLGIIVAATMYSQGNISLFGVLCILLLASEFFIPLRQLGSYFHIAMNGIAASNKIFQILDIDEGSIAIKKLSNEEISIQFEQVNFGYTQERKILKNISMELKPKQFIGIVGESGSGKSTSAKLLAGMVKDYDGHIYVQGIERSEIDDASFASKVMMVTHKPTIFKGSVKENLRVGNFDASEAEMIAVLKQVQLYEFLETQEGLNTHLEENGNNFSGGQNQRLSLARSILADREIYLFDEATSNIDIESEEAILSVIKSLVKTKTVLMITHRLSNIQGCNQIYVLANGACVEEGRHDELMSKHGVYAKLYQQQSELETFEGEGSYE